MTFTRGILNETCLIWATSCENLFMPYANNKGADQPAHPCSRISTFVIRCLDSIIPEVFISKISSLYLAYVAAQAGWSLPWSQTPKTGFFSWGGSFYCNGPKYSDRQVWANSVDPDLKEQSDWGLHFLPFCLHHLDTICCMKQPHFSNFRIPYLLQFFWFSDLDSIRRSSLVRCKSTLAMKYSNT